jgi:hypothetical protein
LSFGIDQDEGWFAIFATQPSRDHIRNFGFGLVGYAGEENGPALRVLCGMETLATDQKPKAPPRAIAFAEHGP